MTQLQEFIVLLRGFLKVKIVKGVNEYAIREDVNGDAELIMPLTIEADEQWVMWDLSIGDKEEKIEHISALAAMYSVNNEVQRFIKVGKEYFANREKRKNGETE